MSSRTRHENFETASLVMELFREILAPDFLLRNSVYMGVLLGLVCPMVGTYLVLRRVVFLGVALPQVSSCGIALAFALHTLPWFPHFDDENLLAFGGASVLTSITILGLTFLERRRRGSVEGRVGVIYALAGAWSILLLVTNPFGEHGLVNRLKGEIIAVSNLDLGLAASCFALVAVLLLLFRKELLLASFDADMARVLQKNVLFWDLLLFLIIGLVVAVAVLIVGPLVSFGFLLFPPMIAYRLAVTMRQLAWISSMVGGATAFIGFCIAYRWDLPTGPTDVALLGAVYGVVMLVTKK